jgi:CBS domain-containing protein
MRCEEIMTRNIATLPHDGTVQAAARLMADKDVGFVPIVDDSGAVIGVLTDRDIAIRVVAKSADVKARLADVASQNVVCCSPRDDVSKAMKLMKEYKVSRILVCDEAKRPVGVISLQDLAEAEDEKETGKTVREVKEEGAGRVH